MRKLLVVTRVRYIYSLMVVWQVLYKYANSQVIGYSLSLLSILKFLYKSSCCFLQIIVIVYAFLCISKMASSHTFKDVVLNNHPVENNLGDHSPNPNSCAPISEPGSADLHVVSLDPPGPPSFPEALILDDLHQVQLDIVDLSQSCLVAKMLGEPVDLRTIISRTRAD